MSQITLSQIQSFVDGKIGIFHDGKLQAIKKLKLSKLLKRKNPYLFKAKNVTTANEFVKDILDAYLSSQEETMFGNFLEKLAIFVCQKAYGGKKAPAEGIDLDFAREGKRYLVSIKSGPNWGNSRQIAKMKDDFARAKRIIGQNVICVNGCCYGKTKNENKGDYIKKCGQSFWEFISGNSNLYKEIIEPLGHKAKQRNEEFQTEYGKVLNKFVKEFVNVFCTKNGAINWEKIVEFNSSMNQRRTRSLDSFSSRT